MRLETKNNKINNVIENAIKSLGGLVDVNTIIGKPIKTDSGEMIIPISKVTIGVLVGGGEYGKLTIFNKSDDLPYSAGNGAIVSIKPCAFLIKENDKHKVLSLKENSYEKFIDKATSFLEKINNEN